MYVFRQDKERQPLTALLTGLQALCRRARDRESRQQLLLSATGLECSLADFWGPARDGLTPGHGAALELSLAAANCYLGSESALPVQQALSRLVPHLPAAATLLPVSEPEGFRYYGLRPEAYLPPARALARAVRSKGAFVLGLRTIGSALGAVVAAVLGQQRMPVAWATVRPRGAPEDRFFAADEALEGALRAWPGYFAIVDEGPGLSASSFGGAVAWLRRLGASPARIVLLPSWDPPAARLRHTVVASSWARWRKFPAAQPPLPVGTDLSAGRWRQALGVRGKIPVWPQRERLKYLSADGRSIYKFAGLGDYGREAAARARRLARAGFTPAAEYVGDGWLRLPRLPAAPLNPDRLDGRGRRWAEWAGRYFAFRRAEFARGPAQPPSEEMRRMVARNAELLLGRAFRMAPREGVPLRSDGRVQACEWGWHAGEFVKFDALDHGDDHFFPGPADIAWDLAGLEFEFGSRLARAACDEYARRSGDAGIRQRLPWYRFAYGIFQAAFAHFAHELVAPPDRAWFLAARDRYLDRLRTPRDEA